MAYTAPLYFTSQLYPVNVLEQFKTGGDVASVAGYDNPSFPDEFKTTANFIAGTLVSSLLTYTFWPVEEFKTAADFLAGTYVLGLVTYTNGLVEPFKTGANFMAGTLILGLTTYTNWPVEEFKTGANFIAGTLT